MVGRENIIELSLYFPKKDFSKWLDNEGIIVLHRLLKIENEPLTRTHLNQLLHSIHQAGISHGFFLYYWFQIPKYHPYPVDKVFTNDYSVPEQGLSKEAIVNINHLKFGIHRFYIDALLFYGNIREAFRAWRTLSLNELELYFKDKSYNPSEMKMRGKVFPMKDIVAEDRHLVSEIACKTFGDGDEVDVEKLMEFMSNNFHKLKEKGRKNIRPYELLKTYEWSEDSSYISSLDSFGECIEEEVQQYITNEGEIKPFIEMTANRYINARQKALENTNNYLTYVNELDVYVATSMRIINDFKEVASICNYLFNNKSKEFHHQMVNDLVLRYFDPTISAAKGHYDKGLIECLMVKCSSVLIFCAGKKSSFGKDAEAAMALSLGKPVIFLCNETKPDFYRDVHPLSRLINFENGVAIGAFVVSNKDQVIKLLYRIFYNKLEFDLEQKEPGFFILKDRISKSIIRLETNDNLLKESFWNYYNDKI